MNPEIKRRWVEALRSGQYQQGLGALNKNGKFCCLGVLCELAVADGVIERSAHPASNLSYGYDELGSDLDPLDPEQRCEYAYLPDAVREWADLPSNNPQVNVPTKYVNLRTLAGLNDGGFSFDYIADRIEESL